MSIDIRAKAGIQVDTGCLKRSRPPPRPPLRSDPSEVVGDWWERWDRHLFDDFAPFRWFARAMEWLADVNAWFWQGVANRIGAGARHWWPFTQWRRTV